MIVSVLLWCLVGAIAVPCWVLLCQCLAGAPATRRGPAASAPAHTQHSFVVLVPAHDEEDSLPGTLASLMSQLTPRGRVLVVADNCSDRTAAVARSAGCDVLERHDDERRGKGFALDVGIASLRQDPPDVVVMVDADCWAEAGAIARLVNASMDARRPVQALYLMDGRSGGGGAVSALAWLVRNYVRPLGMHRWGMPCQLMGSGMAFPWSLVSSVNLASSRLAEDMELGAELACRGYPPQFLPEARIRSRFPETRSGEDVQRERWILGHMRSLRSWFWPLVKAGIVRRRLGPIAMALDMAVPPFTMLAAMAFGAAVLASLAVVGGVAGPWVLVTAVASCFALAAGLLACWFGLPDDMRPDVKIAEIIRAASGSAMLAGRSIRGEAGRSWKRTERGPGA